jgi:hypothetical protein
MRTSRLLRSMGDRIGVKNHFEIPRGIEFLKSAAFCPGLRAGLCFFAILCMKICKQKLQSAEHLIELSACGVKALHIFWLQDRNGRCTMTDIRCRKRMSDS